MNLHGIVKAAIEVVNPPVRAAVLVSTGSADQPDGKRLPTYAPTQWVQVQVQPMTFSDLTQVNGLNIQGIKKSIYMSGQVAGLVRAENKGGDLITLPNGEIWLVVLVLESWPDWCKVAVTLQADSVLSPIIQSRIAAEHYVQQFTERTVRATTDNLLRVTNDDNVRDVSP